MKETSAITFFCDNNGRRYVFWTVAKKIIANVLSDNYGISHIAVFLWSALMVRLKQLFLVLVADCLICKIRVTLYSLKVHCRMYLPSSLLPEVNNSHSRRYSLFLP